MGRVTKIEMETGFDTCIVETDDASFLKKMGNRGFTVPEYNREVVKFEVPKSAVIFRFPRVLSEDELKIRRERLAKFRKVPGTKAAPKAKATPKAAETPAEAPAAETPSAPARSSRSSRVSVAS